MAIYTGPRTSMRPAPPIGNVYALVPSGATNPGSTGVVVAWDTFRAFWGGIAQQGWADLVHTVGIGPRTLL
jgi:hypothetical protein